MLFAVVGIVWFWQIVRSGNWRRLDVYEEKAKKLCFGRCRDGISFWQDEGREYAMGDARLDPERMNEIKGLVQEQKDDII